jgi:aspartate/tyrosine/aromatic aminotransferase
MNGLEEAQADPLLGLMVEARRDDRAEKVDLGVGIYKNEQGETPIMAAVAAAEKLRIEQETTKAYEGPRGNQDYVDRLGRVLLGRSSERIEGFATPGGSGAVYVGMSLAALMSPGARIFVSDPSWPNHIGIAEAARLEVMPYRYRSTADGTPDFDLMMADLSAARAGDVILLQGPCHNPTGTDLSADQWGELASLAQKVGALPFIDIAYQGFGDGLEADAAPIRAFLDAVPEAIVSYSCSKNFGIYRERTGLLLLQGETAEVAARAAGQAAGIVRSTYSMPPAHGPAIVASILADEGLSRQWKEELEQMRLRLGRLRTGFADALTRATNDDRYQKLAHQKGMFSLLPLDGEGAAEALRRDQAIYMPGSGRINVAGLKEGRLEDIAKAMAPFLKSAG